MPRQTAIAVHRQLGKASNTPIRSYQVIATQEEPLAVSARHCQDWKTGGGTGQWQPYTLIPGLIEFIFPRNWIKSKFKEKSSQLSYNFSLKRKQLSKRG